MTTAQVYPEWGSAAGITYCFCGTDRSIGVLLHTFNSKLADPRVDGKRRLQFDGRDAAEMLRRYAYQDSNNEAQLHRGR